MCKFYTMLMWHVLHSLIRDTLIHMHGNVNRVAYNILFIYLFYFLKKSIFHLL